MHNKNPGTLITAVPRILAGAILIAGMSACGADRTAPGSPATAAAASTPGSAAQVERKVGSAVVHAYAMQTSAIPEAVAREHGIERTPELVMLRVSGRTGGEVTTGVPLKVDVRVSDLQGKTQTLPVKEVLVNGLVDYVATVRTTLPDTLRFNVTVTTPDGASDTLELTRNFDRP